MLSRTRTGNGNPQEPPLRVLLIDPHEPSRLGLAMLLNRHPAIDRCVAAGRVDEALSLAERHQPDVVVLDISDRGPFVSETATRVRAAAPTARLILSSRCAGSAAGAAT